MSKTVLPRTAASRLLLASCAATAILTAGELGAQDWKSSFTLHGDVGLIDMPSAGVMQDGALVGTVSNIGPHTRLNFAFQATPRLSALLRFDREEEAQGPGSNTDTHQSLDLRYQILTEGPRRPSLVIGARSLFGDTEDSAEYIVASKTFGSRLQVSGGLGWGRLGSHEPISGNQRNNSPSGDFEISPAFEGEMAAFAGVEYTLTPSWRLKAEYSSDAYRRESANGTVDGDAPYSFGITYAPSQWVQVGAYAVRGEDIGITASLLLDPTSAYAVRGADPVPLPVHAPASAPRAAASWSGGGAAFDASLAPGLREAMNKQGLELIGLQTSGSVMRVRYRNKRYRSEAQGVGRLARILTHVAPAPVREFHLEPVSAGIAKSQVVLRRADLVALENELGAARDIKSRSQVRAAGPDSGLTATEHRQKAFKWSIAPYLAMGKVTDANTNEDEFQYQIGAEAAVRYDFSPNLSVVGSVRQRVAGNFDDTAIAANSNGLPIVRRDESQYRLSDGPELEDLVLSYRTRLSPSLYGRVSAGYLERMYGGINGEILWKPVGSRLGLGAELTYAVKRETTGLGFEDYDTTSGFISAYYEFDGDFIGHVDVGRYLAGDWGTTVGLAREFPNGWTVGGYVTVTDAGDDNIDKGVTISVPVNWLIGTPTRDRKTFTVGGDSTDAGQRVSLDGALYDLVRDSHSKDLQDSWGQFWK